MAENLINFATVEDIEVLFRPLKINEVTRAEKLLEVTSNTLRLEARKYGKDIDEMATDLVYKSVLTSVVIDIVGRALNTATDTEPMSQFSESALGYTVSGTFLTPGGGLFIKKDEYKRLGLTGQRMGIIEPYGNLNRGKPWDE